MKYLEFDTFCRKNNLTVFTIDDLKILFDTYSKEYLRLKLSRWKKQNWIASLKKGLYTFAGQQLDEFEIASKLITPSYISLETALSHYSIIPDVSADIHSITTKNTRTFRVYVTSYHYHHIKQYLFTDFRHLRNDIFIATPEKALLDYFYFRKPDPKHLLFERLNKEVIQQLDLRTMNKIAQKFPGTVQEVFIHFKHVITH